MPFRRRFGPLAAALLVALAGCTVPDEAGERDEPREMAVHGVAYVCHRPALLEEPACREYRALAPREGTPPDPDKDWPPILDIGGELYECTDWNTFEGEGTLDPTLPTGACEAYTWSGETRRAA